MDQPLSFLDRLVIDPSDTKLASFPGLKTYQDLRLSTLDAQTLFSFVRETHQALQTLIAWNQKNNYLVQRICEKLILEQENLGYRLSHLTLHHAFHWDNNIPLDDFHPLSRMGQTLFVHECIISMMSEGETDPLTTENGMMEPLQPQVGLFRQQARQELFRVCKRAVLDESFLIALIKQNEEVGYLSSEALCVLLMEQGLARSDFLKWSDNQVRRQMLCLALEL
jgi:hypothetical protein